MRKDILKQIQYFIRNLSQRYVIDPSKSLLFTETLISANDPECFISEQYRSLAGALLFSTDFKNAKVLLFTSPQPRDGKSTTVANLGYVLSNVFKKKILLIDADLRRPQLHRLFNTKSNNGLSEILSEKIENSKPINLCENLDLIAAGSHNNDAGTLLQNSSRVKALLSEHREQYDLILIDTPPILKVVDACILGSHVDKVLLLVRAQSTPDKMVTESLEQLKTQNVAAAACILLNHPHEMDFYNYIVNPHYRYYYSDFYQGYGKSAK